MRRRVVLVMSVALLALAFGAGSALAAVISGTNGDDRLRGTNGPDAITGKAGDDVLLGLKGSDALKGGPGRDAVLGGNEFGPLRGDRALKGDGGGDFVGGGRGRDALSGGSGKDFLTAGPFNDTAPDAVSGGSGDDAIVARSRPAGRDVIDCGGGFDRVLVDRKDVTKDCERRFTNPNAFFNSISPNYFKPLP